MESREHDAVFEIVQADSSSEWHLLPEKTAEYPIVIRNGTSESHNVELNVVDPVDWATVRPARLALGPGREATTQLVLAAAVETNASAGEHRLTLELHDFEGTSLGQLAASVYVVPYYRLDMSIRVRGPLLRRGLAEGFILNCKVVNRGNAEFVVQPQSCDESCIVLTSPTVRIPVRAEVSFDIEARWQSDPMRSYPETVRVRTRYPRGEVVAEVPWDDVVASLGSLVPPLQEDEGFPEIMLLKAGAQHDASRAEPTILESDSQGDLLGAKPPTEAAPQPDAPDEPEASPTPMRVEITPTRQMKYTYGRRVNPWWPPAECFGGRWRVKALPIVAVVLICFGLFAAAKFDSLRTRGQTAGHTIGFVMHIQRPARPSTSHHTVARRTPEKKASLPVVKRKRAALARPASISPAPIHTAHQKRPLLHSAALPLPAALAPSSNALRARDQRQAPCNTGTQQALVNPTSGTTGVSKTIGQITIVAAGNNNNLFSTHNRWIVTLDDNTGIVWSGAVLKLVSDRSGPHPYPSDFYYGSSIPMLAAERTYRVFLSEPGGACAPQSLGSFST